jgi:hypothetical protein
MVLIHEAIFFLKAAADGAHGVVGRGEGLAKHAGILHVHPAILHRV